MKKTVIPALIFVCLLAVLLSCVKENGANEDLTPFLYQDSLRVWPNPAWLFEDAKFYLAWKDYDGDMEEPTVTLRLLKDDGTVTFIQPEDVVVEGGTGGSLEFTRTILDGDEGSYSLTVTDKAGRISNEVSIFLYVNPVPRQDLADDDTANAQ